MGPQIQSSGLVPAKRCALKEGVFRAAGANARIPFSLATLGSYFGSNEAVDQNAQTRTGAARRTSSISFLSVFPTDQRGCASAPYVS